MTRPARLGVALVLLLATWMLVWFPVSLDDHWWHMLTGRYILDHHAIPHTDPFSFTRHGAPWVNWEWLAGVAMVLAYDAHASWGLIVLRAVAVTTTLAILWVQLDVVHPRGKRAVELTLRLALLSAVLLVVHGRVSDRPHLYALPLVAGAQLLATHAARHRRPAYLVALAILTVPWALLHPSWPLAPVLLATALLEAFLDPKQQPPSWLCRASPLALCIGPLLVHPPARYARATADLFATNSLREWRPLWEYLHYTNTPLLAFVLLALAHIAMLVESPTHLRRPRTWLTFTLFAASLWFVRFTPLYAVVVAPDLYAFAAGRSSAWKLPTRTAHLLTLLLAALLLLVVLETKSIFQQTFSASVDERANPVGVADRMARVGLGGNVLCNELNAHAYLAFRRYPHVLETIDGRIPQLFDEADLVAYRRALSTPEDLDALLDAQPIDHVVVQGIFSPSAVTMSIALVQRRDFELIHIDETSLLFTKTERLAEVAERPPPYRYLVPPLIDDAWFEHAFAPEVFPRVVEEIARLMREEPELPIAITLLQTLAHHPRASAEQRAALNRMLAPPSP